MIGDFITVVKMQKSVNLPFQQILLALLKVKYRFEYSLFELLFKCPSQYDGTLLL